MGGRGARRLRSGQHNREVLAGELGIAEDELARWERDGIIGTQPAWIAQGGKT